MVSVAVCAQIFFLAAVKTQDLTSLIDFESLSELPLGSLLNVRKNILQFEGNDIDTSTKGNGSSYESVPEALPLVGSQKLKSKEGYYVQYGDDDAKKYDKKKSISTIFQLSITTLAFLAFGGYLFYLVTAAIKGKNYNYMYDPNATQVMSAFINAELNTRKKKKRPIRVGGAGNFGYKQGYNNKTHKKLRNKREVPDHDVNAELLYSALTDLCEGYTKFYELDNAETELKSCHHNNTCTKMK